MHNGSVILEVIREQPTTSYSFPCELLGNRGNADMPVDGSYLAIGSAKLEYWILAKSVVEDRIGESKGGIAVEKLAGFRVPDGWERRRMDILDLGVPRVKVVYV